MCKKHGNTSGSIDVVCGQPSLWLDLKFAASIVPDWKLLLLVTDSVQFLTNTQYSTFNPAVQALS